MRSGSSYALVTAAHNEEGYLEQTIASVLRQSPPPVKWIIVDDGSTDKTAQIIDSFACHVGFIEKLNDIEKHEHCFAALARAQMAGYAALKNVSFDFIGMLDADIVLPDDYYRSVIDLFEKDPALGMAGGFIYEKEEGVYKSRQFNRRHSVAGAIQMFRREVFERVGGIAQLKYGGHDWLAEIKVRMYGWNSIAIPELEVHHLRQTGVSAHPLRRAYREGRMDYSVGSHPLYELFKCVGRIPGKPFGVGAFTRFAGYMSSWLKSDQPDVSNEVRNYLRDSQLTRVKSILVRK